MALNPAADPAQDVPEADTDQGPEGPDYVPPPISGEALLAVTGIRGILERTPKRITMADKDAAERLPREIRRSIRRFLDDEGGPRKVSRIAPFDYQWALEHIQAALEPHHVEAIAESFRPEDHEVAADYLRVAQNVIHYLQSILPIRTEETMSQSFSLDPSDTEIARFRRAYDVANDPMVILRDMEGSGALIPEQVNHLKMCYPDLHGFIQARMGTGLAEAMARHRKGWKLSYRRDRLVQILFGTTTWSKDLASDLQSNFKLADKMEGQKGGPAPAKSQSKAASNVQTKVGAIAEGPAS